MRIIDMMADKYIDWLLGHFGKLWGLIIGSAILMSIVPIYWLIVWIVLF